MHQYASLIVNSSHSDDESASPPPSPPRGKKSAAKQQKKGKQQRQEPSAPPGDDGPNAAVAPEDLGGPEAGLGAHQRGSLILFEGADLLLEEDRGFVAVLADLIEDSKVGCRQGGRTF